MSKHLSVDELEDRVVRFYNRYSRDLELVARLLETRLNQLALSYTIENKLPPEAITVKTRIKSLRSTLKKLKRKDWPQFSFVTDVIGDIIGVRVVCWFLDDCQRFLQLISQSSHINLYDIEDYMQSHKESGYRSIHAAITMEYDGVEKGSSGQKVKDNTIRCEIQIRTKLQDAWADLTHEFHYKALDKGVKNNEYEKIMAGVADRLAIEDKGLINLRDMYQNLIGDRKEGQVQEIPQTGEG